MVVSEQPNSPISFIERGYLLAHAFAQRPREENYILSHAALKWIGLHCPVNNVKRGDVAVEAVFCPLMVGQHHLFGSHICLSNARAIPERPVFEKS